VLIWPDRDTQIFYSHLVDASQFVTSTQQQQAVVDDKEQQQQRVGGEHGPTSDPAAIVKLMESVEEVDLSELEKVHTFFSVRKIHQKSPHLFSPKIIFCMQISNIALVEKK
jgi:hypothetical protein